MKHENHIVNGTGAVVLKAPSGSKISSVCKAFIRAIKLFFRNYYNFRGRSSRSEFWYAFLFVTLVGAVLGYDEEVPVLSVLSCIWAIVTLIPLIAVTVRRLHDTGRSSVILIITGGAAAVFFTMVFGCTNFTRMAGESPSAVEKVYVAVLALIGIAFLGLLVYLIVLLCQPGRKKNKYGKAAY